MLALDAADRRTWRTPRPDESGLKQRPLYVVQETIVDELSAGKR
jgi:hypothetical protein